MGDSCDINGYYKRISNIDECQSACENNTACTAFSILETHFYGNICYIHGNISSVNNDSWAIPDVISPSDDGDGFFWTPIPWTTGQSTFGYEGFKVTSTSNRSNAKCFKRLNEGHIHDGKFLNHSRPER